MRKLFFLICLIAGSFLVFSFSPLDKSKGVYDRVSGNLLFDAGVVATFTSSYEKATDVLVTWEKWHKYWTRQGQLNETKISNVLAKY
jgi:hypothetical protein